MSTRIGIVGWNVGANSFGVTHSYLEFISLFGEAVILSPSKKIEKNLDLLILPGGQDLLSSKYDQVPSFLNSNPDLFKEFFFENNLKHYIDQSTPIFGICLGHQQIQVLFGGVLDQNCGHPYSTKDRQELVHELTFTAPYENLRHKLKLGKKFEVNSMHHQGIELENLADGLEAIAVGPRDVVEVLRHKELPIYSVQYHCEELYDPLSIHLVKSLLEKSPVAKKLAVA